MLRVVALFIVAALGLAAVLMGGQIGPVDLTEVPLPLVGFLAVGGLLLFGLSYI
jgi:hypothetical protein